METQKQYCPICKTEVRINPRYPKYVCNDCYALSADKDGRKLLFSNRDIGGGFIAHYQDSGEEYKSHACFINGIECIANEARFGGIVVQIKYDELS
ncbi:MAG: hypothetical protein IPM42_15665 [Saprospiraceae bacterium]|nr:hypothetical protein [Saprospiraceae bacterium]